MASESVQDGCLEDAPMGRSRRFGRSVGLELICGIHPEEVVVCFWRC